MYVYSVLSPVSVLMYMGLGSDNELGLNNKTIQEEPLWASDLF